MRPASLRTNSHAPAVTTTRNAPAIQNQVLISIEKLSNPDRPLLEPVKVPPEYRICATMIGSTSVTTDAYSGEAP